MEANSGPGVQIGLKPRIELGAECIMVGFTWNKRHSDGKKSVNKTKIEDKLGRTFLPSKRAS